jgi:hypothetical protein
MGSADWTLPAHPAYLYGVTSGVARPPGGGGFVLAVNSLAGAATALEISQADVLVKGGSIRGALQRGPSDARTGWAAALRLLNDGGDAYLLGLSDSDPSRIVLARRAVDSGLPDLLPGIGGVLRCSDAVVDVGEWVHLRLDVTITGGAALLEVYRNDLAAHPLDAAPDWQPIPGMDPVNDAAAIMDGVAGVIVTAAAHRRRAYFAALELHRQV